MRQGRVKGWNRGSSPQRLTAGTKCDLIRQGRSFKCTDLSLSTEELCSHCRAKQSVESDQHGPDHS